MDAQPLSKHQRNLQLRSILSSCLCVLYGNRMQCSSSKEEKPLKPSAEGGKSLGCPCGLADHKGSNGCFLKKNRRACLHSQSTKLYWERPVLLYINWLLWIEAANHMLYIYLTAVHKDVLATSSSWTCQPPSLSLSLSLLCKNIVDGFKPQTSSFWFRYGQHEVYLMVLIDASVLQTKRIES